MEQTLTSRWGLEPVVVAEEPEPSKDDIDHDGDEITGKTLWDCSKVLHDLVADPDTGNEFSVRGKRVIELGAGTGALSVGLARAGAASVICTDLPCHLGLIQATVDANMSASIDDDSKHNRNTSTESSGSSCSSISRDASSSSVGNTSDLGYSDNGSNLGRRGEREGGVEGGSSDVDVRIAAATPSPVPRATGKVVVADVIPLRWGDVDGIRRVLSLGREGDSVLSAVPQHIKKEEQQQGKDKHDQGEKEKECRPPFDVIVLSEVLYWPALDLLQEDTREPLRSTLVALSGPGTTVVLVYKERWPDREKGFLESCTRHFEVTAIPEGCLKLPSSTPEMPGSNSIRGVVMRRLSDSVLATA